MPAPAAVRPVRTHQPALLLDRAALRSAREAAGLSLREVGRVVGRSWVTVHTYEAEGGHDVPASMLGALAGLYGVKVDHFYRKQ